MHWQLEKQLEDPALSLVELLCRTATEIDPWMARPRWLCRSLGQDCSKDCVAKMVAYSLVIDYFGGAAVVDGIAEMVVYEPRPRSFHG